MFPETEEPTFPPTWTFIKSWTSFGKFLEKTWMVILTFLGIFAWFLMGFIFGVEVLLGILTGVVLVALAVSLVLVALAVSLIINECCY